MAVAKSEMQELGNSHSSRFATLYVGDLSPDVTEEDLTRKFSLTVPVVSVHLCRNSVTGKSMCYAYVNFDSPFSASNAMACLNHTELKGKTMRIMWAQKDLAYRRSSGFRNLFVKNLHSSITSSCLERMFNPFGVILSCKVAEENGQSKGFGFVQFDTEQSAVAARCGLHDTMVDGKRLFVAKFINKSERAEKVTAILGAPPPPEKVTAILGAAAPPEKEDATDAPPPPAEAAAEKSKPEKVTAILGAAAPPEKEDATDAPPPPAEAAAEKSKPEKVTAILGAAAPPEKEDATDAPPPPAEAAAEKSKPEKVTAILGAAAPPEKEGATDAPPPPAEAAAANGPPPPPPPPPLSLGDFLDIVGSVYQRNPGLAGGVSDGEQWQLSFAQVAARRSERFARFLANGAFNVKTASGSGAYQEKEDATDAPPPLDYFS